MKLNRRRQHGVVPLNAMSDVAFLLLIFIMLVSLITYRKEVKIEYPEAAMALRTSAEKNLEIWIDRTGGAYLDGTAATTADIENALIDMYTSAPDTRVHLIADRDTPFRHVQTVLSLLQTLEHRVVSLVVHDSAGAR